MSRPRNPALLIRLINFFGNLTGAVVAFLYFRVVDRVATNAGEVRLHEIVLSIIAFVVLVTIGMHYANRWLAPIGRAVEGNPLSERETAVVRRRVLLFPYFMAGLSMVGWTFAGLIYGIVFPMMMGATRTPLEVARQVFGTTVIAGGATAALIFFASEYMWRKRLPFFFPEGDLRQVRRVPRLAVRTRLLAIFLMIGVVPLVLLSIVSYNRALALVGADPMTAADIVDDLRLIILFLLGVGILAAVGLSIFAANSVAAPLREVESAMAQVERGELDGRAPVVSTDEIGSVAEGFNRMLQGLREREMVKETFGRYVTPEVRDEILAGRIRGEGELKEATILFADLRDYTPWVEATAPRQVVQDLNEYFTEMDQAIRAHRGLVLQIVGDEIEAVFGAPIATVDHPEMAVRAALEMRRRLRALNARREAAGKPALRNGIGIHTGTVLAGSIGGAERLSYALVGDPVNLASRIQGLTKDFKAEILISEATRVRLDGAIPVEELPAVRVKGRAAEVNVYKVV
ncbi:MAG TPA: adenylate/guanylate cyclase domain-containing protein [Methylomirabilota bacterium]|nr:adenylate/guanylate cyclase domain-containing protein [Methylomirabilota bacterium]